MKHCNDGASSTSPPRFQPPEVEQRVMCEGAAWRLREYRRYPATWRTT